MNLQLSPYLQPNAIHDSGRGTGRELRSGQLRGMLFTLRSVEKPIQISSKEGCGCGSVLAPTEAGVLVIFANVRLVVKDDSGTVVR